MPASVSAPQKATPVHPSRDRSADIGRPRALGRVTNGSFRLVRYFASASLAFAIAVAVGLGLFYSWKAERGLLQQGEQKNSAQVRLILNHLQDVDRATLESLLQARSAPAAEAPNVQRMTAVFLQAVKGTSIIKLKLYNLRGLTVYSTEAAQVGEDKSTYPGFVAARDGGAASQISRRETFVSLRGMLREVDVIGSYLPVHDGAGKVIGVVEIYDNVTQLAGAIRDTRWQVMGLSALALLVLWVGLLAIVMRADRILRQKEAALHSEVELRGRVAGDLQRALKAAEKAQLETERAYAQATAARREAEAASAARGEFLAASHETMRTPLNSAIGVIDVLRTGTLTAAQRDQLDAVRGELLQLLDLLSEQLKKSADSGTRPA